MARFDKGKIIGLLLCLGAVILVGVGWAMARSNADASTDNAYVRGDVTSLAPKVAGYITAVEVEDNERAGIDIRNVPFKGASDALTAVASGIVDLAFADITASTELIKAGKLRALAVASDRRAAALPAVPHMGEAGLPGFGAYVWVGAMVSSKAPKTETDKLAALLGQIERMPETREFYEKLGAETMQGGAEEMRRFQASEIELWKRIAVKAKVEQE